MTEQQERARKMFTGARAWDAEGARVGLVTCMECGAAVLLDHGVDAMAVHMEWHDREDAS